MAQRRGVLPPSSLGDVLKFVVEFDTHSFDELLTAVSGPKSFSIDDHRVESLSNKVSQTKPNVAYLLAALAFLYEQVEDAEGIDDRDVRIGSVIADLDLYEDDEKGREALQTRLRHLLVHNDGHDRFKKAKRLQDGFIASALSFNSFVDLRPNYDQQKRRIDGFVLIIQFNILTDSMKNHEKSFTFQLSKSSFSEMKKAMDEAQNMINALENSHFTSEIQLEFD
jgi:hypothetical protein